VGLWLGIFCRGDFAMERFDAKTNAIYDDVSW
jgi:hypothetical protein